MSSMSTKDVATQLGVPLGTVKRWVDEAGVPVAKDSAGARRFGPDGVEALRRVQKLLGEGRHMKSIRVILAPEGGPEASPIPVRAEPELTTGLARAEIDPPLLAIEDEIGPVPVPVRAQPDLEEVAAAVGRQVTEHLVDVLRRETALAEKYARATHLVGQLEATVAARDADLARVTNELAEARKLLAAPPAPRPWWRRWI